MEIKLDLEEFDYLSTQLANERDDLAQHFKGVKQTGKITIELRDDVADEIRDWAEEKLQKAGFDEDYNLTKEGEILEGLSNSLYS